MTIFFANKNRGIFTFVIYAVVFLNQIKAADSKFYNDIEMIVKSCYQDRSFCKQALLKVNKYQKKASANKKFSCQTRLLGLEANLIMAMNDNLRKMDAKSIIYDVKRYC